MLPPNITLSLQKFEAFSGLKPEDLSLMKGRGLAHDHINLGDTGWLLRVPRGNQLGMGDADYLALQENIYASMAASQSTPQVMGVIEPGENLPHGALIVERIVGRDIRYESDLSAVAECLARIHRMPVPQDTGLIEKASAPLGSQKFLLEVVFNESFKNAALPQDTRLMLQEERASVLDSIQRLDESGDTPLSLIGGDSHLGNYLIDERGKAWLVDLEFATYDLALIDCADAILPITSKLDPHIGVIPSQSTAKSFYQMWEKVLDENFAQRVKGLIPLTEQIVFLRTLAWLSYWRAEGKLKEDEKVSPTSRDNWDNMAAYYLDPKVLRRSLVTQQGASQATYRKPSFKPK